MTKPKTLEQLRAEKERAETQLAQEQHKLERLENRKKYLEKGERTKRTHRLVRFARVDWCLSLFKFIATILFALFYVQSVFAHEFVATITKIQDGDTLSAIVNNEETKIRLLDVDCYETKNNARARIQ